MLLKYAHQGHVHICCWSCHHGTVFKTDHSYFLENWGFPKDQVQVGWAGSTFHLFQSSSISPVCLHNLTGSLDLRTDEIGVQQNQQMYNLVLHHAPWPSCISFHGQNMEIKWQKVLFFFVTSLIVESQESKTKKTNRSRRSQGKKR